MGALIHMMFFVFIALAVALALAWYGSRQWALACAGLFFVLALKQFLWEIHSPVYGYKMPWIQVQTTPTETPTLTADNTSSAKRGQL